MLFSEPKIPQLHHLAVRTSALCPFQCSSASRKFLNRPEAFCRCDTIGVSVLFSEPKIPQLPLRRQMNRRHAEFQCSSASRKFLNCRSRSRVGGAGRAFQCSSASRKFLNYLSYEYMVVVFDVSVLFSEPKIPQLTLRANALASLPCFSALQRAENSSIVWPRAARWAVAKFQCSSASRKFLN